MSKVERRGAGTLAKRQSVRVWHAEECPKGMPKLYDRGRDLPRLVPMWPCEMAAADMSEAGHVRLLGRIARALRKERQYGVAGHWTYDAGRHRGLIAAMAAERALYKSRWGSAPSAP